MGLFKNLAKVFVDFEDENRPETKEDVTKALSKIQSEGKSHKSKKTIHKTSSNNKKEEILEIDDVFAESGLTNDSSGNTIYKVFEILQSPQLKGLDPKTIRTAVLLNLDMNKIPIDEIINDGKKRVEILNNYEKEKEKDVSDLEKEMDEKNQAIQEEINAFLEQKKKEVELNNKKVEDLKTILNDWGKVKEEEMNGLQELINYLSNK